VLSLMFRIVPTSPFGAWSVADIAATLERAERAQFAACNPHRQCKQVRPHRFLPNAGTNRIGSLSLNASQFDMFAGPGIEIAGDLTAGGSVSSALFLSFNSADTLTPKLTVSGSVRLTNTFVSVTCGRRGSRCVAGGHSQRWRGAH
jgi:hypothetical protein